MMDMKDFLTQMGRTASSLRQQKKLTQMNVASKAGLDLSLVSRLERGTVNPSIGTLLKLAKGLDCNLKDLIPDSAQYSLEDITKDEN